MKKLFIFILSLTFVFHNSIVFAKVIQLKDGSVIKGNVIGFQNGVYTIQNSQLGNIQIADADIRSISEESPALAIPNNAPSSMPNDMQTQVKEQTTEIQKQILSNPQLMQDVQSLAGDPEIQKLLSDPQVLQTIMTYDPNKIEQNESVKKLMQNPKMQALMQKMAGQMR